MYTIILIEKDGGLTQKQVKSFDKLHTTCNYRNNNHFGLLYTWSINDETIYELYGKTTKKNNNENLYPFNVNLPKLYGNLCIIKRVSNESCSITISEWENYHGTFIVKELKEPENQNENENNEEIENPYTVYDDKELLHEEYEDEC